VTQTRVAIVQEYVPRYRAPFFSGLVDDLRKVDIECIVVAGQPVGTLAVRGDATKDTPWMRTAEPRRIRFGNKVVHFHGTDRHWRDCQGVVMELRGSSPDLNAELLRKPFSGRRVGVWGHVRPFIQAGHPVDLAIERRQMRRSDHVFAYTPSGAEFARASGVDPTTVTAVMNSTDVSLLVGAVDSVQQQEVTQFQNEHGLVLGKTFGYIGALDVGKRIDFIATVLDELWQHDPEVKLLVGGQGDQKPVLAAAEERGQVAMLGYVGPTEKAMIARVTQALVNPGRVGLLAVECMAIGLPILTTAWDYHAPEYEYLAVGDDVFVSADHPDDFARLMLDQTRDDGSATRHVGRAYPSLHNMIANFSRGIQEMMFGDIR
jgi:glycosyltransferase involved in cell wall biosynthesis